MRFFASRTKLLLVCLLLGISQSLQSTWYRPPYKTLVFSSNDARWRLDGIGKNGEVPMYSSYQGDIIAAFSSAFITLGIHDQIPRDHQEGRTLYPPRIQKFLVNNNGYKNDGITVNRHIFEHISSSLRPKVDYSFRDLGADLEANKVVLLRFHSVNPKFENLHGLWGLVESAYCYSTEVSPRKVVESCTFNFHTIFPNGNRTKVWTPHVNAKQNNPSIFWTEAYIVESIDKNPLEKALKKALVLF